MADRPMTPEPTPEPRTDPSAGGAAGEAGQPFVQSRTVDPDLLDIERRRANKLPEREDEPGPVVVELNLRHELGLRGAEARFRELYEQEIRPWTAPPAPLAIANTYYRCDLSVEQVRRLVRRDREARENRQRAIYHVWMDYLVRRLIDRSIPTVKADAARRSYDASGAEITWAVIDSGIDQTHPHFRTFSTLSGDVESLHRDFTLQVADGDEHSSQDPVTPPAGDPSALTDPCGHGTHVAGIIAGGLPERLPRGRKVPLRVAQHVSVHDYLDIEHTEDHEPIEERQVADPSRLAGVAPRCKLVSLKVLNEEGEGRASDVIRALAYVRTAVNGEGKLLRIHGVNLSVGYEFNARAFACGQSPLCVEVDRLVRSGVVVVAAAGNTGYGELNARVGPTNTGLSLTINDPGNAALAITVGSTHRDMPHTYGVSYFSSKGPTGDGRLKPDLVAPGERITSCATGAKVKEIKRSLGLDGQGAADGNTAFYIDDSGTSMAAPHVSGAIAAFLSIRREFIGRPEEVKRIFLETATSLGRERYFQGHGLIDLMRAIQAV